MPVFATKDKMQQEITDYYNQLAQQYDDDRFGNSYGQYLHRQERNMLIDLVPKRQPPIVSLGCGTGRLMELATHGADISPEMVKVAKAKYPDKIFSVCPAASTPYPDSFFEGAFCLHVLMHLPVDSITAILAEGGRIIKPGGWLALDFPSSVRRSLANKKGDGWHGNTRFSIKEFEQLAEQHGWRYRQYRGLLLFPVHRLPTWARPLLYHLDFWLCRTPMKKYASYYLLLLQKQ
jgi:ubiquinone/menaquinone biosynthesis C-methylase UbiE